MSRVPVTTAVAALLAGVPLLCAVAGPVLAPLLPVPGGSGALLPPGPGHPLGTDALGRDVLTLALTGGYGHQW